MLDGCCSFKIPNNSMFSAVCTLAPHSTFGKGGARLMENVLPKHTVGTPPLPLFGRYWCISSFSKVRSSAVNPSKIMKSTTINQCQCVRRNSHQLPRIRQSDKLTVKQHRPTTTTTTTVCSESWTEKGIGYKCSRSTLDSTIRTRAERRQIVHRRSISRDLLFVQLHQDDVPPHLYYYDGKEERLRHIDQANVFCAVLTM